jgi:hypothetical protein
MSLFPRMAMTPVAPGAAPLPKIADHSWEAQMLAPPLPDIFEYMERAGRLQFGDGLSRVEAENIAAQQFGFVSANALRREYLKAFTA